MPDRTNPLSIFGAAVQARYEVGSTFFIGAAMEADKVTGFNSIFVNNSAHAYLPYEAEALTGRIGVGNIWGIGQFLLAITWAEVGVPVAKSVHPGSTADLEAKRLQTAGDHSRPASAYDEEYRSNIARQLDLDLQYRVLVTHLGYQF